ARRFPEADKAGVGLREQGEARTEPRSVNDETRNRPDLSIRSPVVRDLQRGTIRCVALDDRGRNRILGADVISQGASSGEEVDCLVCTHLPALGGSKTVGDSAIPAFNVERVDAASSGEEIARRTMRLHGGGRLPDDRRRRRGGEHEEKSEG